MSSTPSISSISRWWSPGRHGAKPTPQLPITTDVTPCSDDGCSRRVPGDLAVVVGVDVDEARRDQQAGGVDLLAPDSVDAPDRRDARLAHGDVTDVRLVTRTVDDRPSANHQVVARPHAALPGYCMKAPPSTT